MYTYEQTYTSIGAFKPASFHAIDFPHSFESPTRKSSDLFSHANIGKILQKLKRYSKDF